MPKTVVPAAPELSELEQSILGVLTDTRYIGSNIWLDTPDSGAVFADFFKVLWELVRKGFVKEWKTEYSALGSIPHGQREFFLSQQGLRWKERHGNKDKKHGIRA